MSIKVGKERNQTEWINENSVIIDQNTPHGVSTMRNIMKSYKWVLMVEYGISLMKNYV